MPLRKAAVVGIVKGLCPLLLVIDPVGFSRRLTEMTVVIHMTTTNVHLVEHLVAVT